MSYSAKRYRFGADFEGILQENRKSKHWYSIDWRECATVKTAYIFSAASFFILLCIFGILNIKVTESCRVVESDGRCCRCLSAQENVSSSLQQPMPYEKTYNDVYHGILMIICAFFGLTYMYLGISEENRFVFVCMFATQGIDMLRLLLDVALESPEHSARRLGRQIVLGIAALMMLISWSLVRRMYKMFGWRIFRRGGAKRSVREMYKTYQRYRACNLLDFQASVLLFLVMAFFVQSTRREGFWVLLFVFLCEATATRCAVKYLKMEDYYGAALSAVCKLVAIVWWTTTIVEYGFCWRYFQESRHGTHDWWLGAFFPSMDSVASYYAGQECRPSDVAYDDRVLELLIINYTFAVIFRIASLVFGLKVVQNFGKGMINVFYVFPKTLNDDADDEISENLSVTRNRDAFEDSYDEASQSMKEASQGLLVT